MHTRIRYHFLADLDVTRDTRETESEKHIQNTPNKPFRVELVTSRNRDYRPYAISEHSFLYTIENSQMDWSWESQTSTNTSELDHQQRWEIREMTRRMQGSLSKVEGRESLIFQTYVTFSIDFPNTHITIICLIHFFCYFVKKGDFSRPAPTRFSPLFFIFPRILFLTKHDKIMS